MTRASSRRSPGTAGSATSTSDGRTLAAVFAAALLVRLLHLVLSSQGQGELVGDALDYHDYAASLLDAGRFANAGGLRASRMPGYPLLLAGLYAVFGRSVLPVQLLQCALGAGTCVLVWRLAQDWVGERWALLAAALAAVSRDLVTPCARVLTEAPVTFLVTLALWFLSRKRPAGRAEAAQAGLAAGAAYLMRSEVLLLAPVLAAVSWWRSPGKGLRRAAGAGALLMSFSLWAAPWALRNRSVLGRALVSTSVGGFNLYEWGLPRAAGRHLGGPGEGERWKAPKGLGELERDDAYRRAAARFYTETPVGRLAAAALVSALVFYYPFLPGYDPTLGFILPWALWGLWLARRDARQWAAAAWVDLLTALHAFVAVTESRHRQKLAPVLVLLGVSALKELARREGERTAWKAAGAWAAFNVLVWIFSPWARQAVLAILR